jgi:hypothetical protein
MQYSLPFGTLEIEGQTALVASGEIPSKVMFTSGKPGQLREQAMLVPTLRAFNFDDFRTEIGKDSRSRRRCYVACYI